MKESFDNKIKPAWCNGCTNFGILTAVKKAFIKLDLPANKIVLVSGIGQAAKLPHYLNCNVFNGLHGRALPVATGIKAVNPQLTVVTTCGDGDFYGEGGNHFLHTIRRNTNITSLVHNNQVYALTKGQASPTTELGTKTRLQFDGVKEEPLNPLLLAITMNCSFVARGFAGNIEHLSDLIVEAINHKGFSLIDIIQPCITFGIRQVPYFKEKIYYLDKSYDPTDKYEAIKKAQEWEQKIPIGVLFKINKKNIFPEKEKNLIDENLFNKDVVEELINTFK